MVGVIHTYLASLRSSTYISKPTLCSHACVFMYLTRLSDIPTSLLYRVWVHHLPAAMYILTLCLGGSFCSGVLERQCYVVIYLDAVLLCGLGIGGVSEDAGRLVGEVRGCNEHLQRRGPGIEYQSC